MANKKNQSNSAKKPAAARQSPKTNLPLIVIAAVVVCAAVLAVVFGGGLAVGSQAGGCNPWPIFAEDKTVTESSIQISYDFLRESSSIFKNWKL